MQTKTFNSFLKMGSIPFWVQFHTYFQIRHILTSRPIFFSRDPLEITFKMSIREFYQQHL